MKYAPWALLALIVMGAWWQVDDLKAKLASATQVRDSLFLEDAAHEAELQGWAVRFANDTMSLKRRIALGDSTIMLLSRTMDARNAKIRGLLDVVASLNDSLTSVGTPGDTTAFGTVAYNGGLDDGLLRGSWRFLAPELSLRYSVDVPLEIVTSEGGDGRWLVTARATDPRASVAVQDFWFDPPPPVEVQRCSLGQTAKRVGLGVLTGLVLGR